MFYQRERVYKKKKRKKYNVTKYVIALSRFTVTQYALNIINCSHENTASLHILPIVWITRKTKDYVFNPLLFVDIVRII